VGLEAALEGQQGLGKAPVVERGDARAIVLIDALFVGAARLRVRVVDLEERRAARASDDLNAVDDASPVMWPSPTSSRVWPLTSSGVA